MTEACGSSQCAGDVPDGCGGTIACPANCPSGEICNPIYGSPCCTSPVSGESLPNQCPPVCPKCPPGYRCAAGIGAATGYCVVDHLCPIGTHYCPGEPSCLPGATGIPCPSPPRCTPKTVAEACGSLQCAGNVSDGCGGTIACPANCPSGEVCNPINATGANFCCTQPVPGKTLPNQCPSPGPPPGCGSCDPSQGPVCCACKGGVWRDGLCLIPSR